MRVALLGFGGFGRALATLLDRAGRAWRCVDPRAAESLSLPEALRGADVVGVCVKEADLAAALEHARPHLSDEALVMDVCARKAGPCATLLEVLGHDQPHAGSHPRFGARSLELGLPLEVTLCSSGGAPGSLQRAQAFWEGLGCSVRILRPEVNDQGL
jgi:prephenate dehydrogenase